MTEKLRYVRPLGQVDEDRLKALTAFALEASKSGVPWVVVPPGTAVGELGGAEVSNPAPRFQTSALRPWLLAAAATAGVVAGSLFAWGLS